MTADQRLQFERLELMKELDVLEANPFSSNNLIQPSVGQCATDSNECDGSANGGPRSCLVRGRFAASGSIGGGSAMLPWGACKERVCFPQPINAGDSCLASGEFVMRTLFAEFTAQAERKIEAIMLEPLERTLSKSLQRGEDAQFDQLLTTFGSVAEHCLASLLRTLFAWYDRQGLEAASEPPSSVRFDKGRLESAASTASAAAAAAVGAASSSSVCDRQEWEQREDRRDLAVEFVFCLVLIEVLRQLHLHPGHDDLIRHLENMAFRHFKYRESTSSGPNAVNVNLIADLYAEVVGVLAQSRFQSVRTRFMHELRELKAKESSQQTSQGIIALLMGMKFFRVKMVPIEDFEASFLFMQELSQYFLEVKDKDIKHALAGLFVEILVPVAACVKNEVNVPCLKSFVEMLYTHTLDMCTKGKHRLAIFPLVTCLLCVSQKQFFLSNWHYFLAMCLSHLKNKDVKMSRVALESLYRLLWVYMIRIKCESNTATQSRLQSIVNSLFPKGSKNVMPRDTPLNIFVKIIQFIAQERLDFAMREIVFDLLSVGRSIKIVTTPERMSIGLRAFLVVADSLQQKEGQPPMPRTVAVLPSGNTLRVKKTFLSSMLTEDTARNIGVASYYPYVRKVFGDTLRALNNQFGRPLLMTNTQNVNKEPDEMITGERKPKIDLFRTCVAAIPRLIPDGLSRGDVIEMLVRLTVHMDEELRALSFQSLQNLVTDIPEWREHVLLELVTFIGRGVPDTNQQLLDNALRMLLQLLSTWRNAVGAPSSSAATRHRELNELRASAMDGGESATAGRVDAAGVVHTVEGLGLVMLCHCRLSTRRLAVHILKEAKLVFRVLGACCEGQSSTVIDVIDAACPAALERCMSVLPSGEKAAVQAACGTVDLQWIAERSCAVWTAGVYDDGARSASLHYLAAADAWRICLAAFLQWTAVPSSCAHSVACAWPTVHHRLHALLPSVDPPPVSENRGSLLRATTAPKRPTDQRDIYIDLWRNYAMFACRVVPAAVTSSSAAVRCLSPDLAAFSAASSGPSHMSDSLTASGSGGASTSLSAFGAASFGAASFIGGGGTTDTFRPGDPATLHRMLVPLLRCDGCVELRDGVTEALGRINQNALPDLMHELVGHIREAIDRKQENMRRRRRRDALRLQLISVFETIADQGTFGACAGVLDSETQSLHASFVEYIDGARQCLEAEYAGDKEGSAGSSTVGSHAIRLKFCSFVRKLIRGFPLETRTTLLKRELRASLFHMLAGWSDCLCGSLGGTNQQHDSGSSCRRGDAPFTELQLAAAHAAWAVLCCGPVFDHTMLLDDGPLYTGLQQLLSAAEPASLQQLARETVVLLLEFNADASALLDWVVDACYSGNVRLADNCFHALATVFAAKEYPCDHYTAIINVTLLHTGCARGNVHEIAFQLLQLLELRFFGREDCRLSDTEETGEHLPQLATLNGRLATLGFCRSQMFLSRQMAQLHPQLTMPMFSEITSRVQTACSEARQLMLQYLLPWLHNMQLVDPHVQSTAPGSSTSRVHFSLHHPHVQHAPHEHVQQQQTCEPWGCVEATEMVLNNLLYITAQLGDRHAGEIEQLWAALCCAWPNNLRIMLHYLFIVCGMAAGELLVYGRRVAVFLSRACPDRLVDELVAELGTVESTNYAIERTETPPFFRLTSLRKVSNQSITDDLTAGEAFVSESGRTGDETSPTNDRGTFHTKRHSGEEMVCTSEMSGLRGVSHSGPSSIHGYCGVVTGVGRSAQEAVVKSRAATIGQISGAAATPAVTDNFAVLRAQTESEESPVVPNSHHHHHHRQAGLSTCDKTETPQPRPLPMPEYGGYFAPLSKFLPHCSQPLGTFHRCNLALMLIQDVVLECPFTSAELWAPHVPLMLHIVFLGGDHSRPLVHDSCRRLLLNLLMVVAAHGDHSAVARAQLSRRIELLDYGIVPLSSAASAHVTTTRRITDTVNSEQSRVTHESIAVCVSGEAGESTGGREVQCCDASTVPSEGDGGPQSLMSVVSDVDECGDTTDSAAAVNTLGIADGAPLPHRCLALIDYLSTHRPHQPLWSHEDVTARDWNIASAHQLSALLQCVVSVFADSLPMARVRERWARLTMQLALGCSSRHLAGRSLQIFRALRLPIGGEMLAEILSRLVETVGEQGEDMQGYVAELVLTVEAAVDCVDSEFRPLDNSRELFKSTPNLLNNLQPPRRPLVTGSVGPTCGSQLVGQLRATGGLAAVGGVRKRLAQREQAVLEVSGDASEGSTGASAGNSLGRSRSASSLRQMTSATDNPAVHQPQPDSEENKLLLLTQFFWLSVCLLESDYEYEYLLAMRLLHKVMSKVSLERRDCCDKIDKMQTQLRWPGFPGVHALLLKGCTNAATYDAAIELISRCTPLLDVSVIDPSLSVGFPLNVLALLPHMVLHYDDADPFCVRAADRIAEACMQRSQQLENLATVMTLYSRRTFSKESVQWTKCVVKYLTDTYGDVSVTGMLFLIEMFDKGPPFLQLPILSVLVCLLHYMDASRSGSSFCTRLINADLLLAMTRCVQLPSSLWRDALRILKLAVSQSSTLPLAPNVGGGRDVVGASAVPRLQMLAFSGGSGGGAAESGVVSEPRSVATKKELPGRTMEFSFDVSLTPIIGRHVASPPVTNATDEQDMDVDGVDRVCLRRAAGNGDVGATAACTNGTMGGGGWRRPWLSQTRTRDRLVQLVVSCGSRVGLPKSPSVIFSQSSDVLERQSSMASSTEEVSAAAAVVHASVESLDDHEAQQFGVIREFDFLEYELESQEGEGMDNFNWGVRRRSLLNPDCDALAVLESDASLPSMGRVSPPCARSMLIPASVAAVVRRTASGGGNRCGDTSGSQSSAQHRGRRDSTDEDEEDETARSVPLLDNVTLAAQSSSVVPGNFTSRDDEEYEDDESSDSCSARESGDTSGSEMHSDDEHDEEDDDAETEEDGDVTPCVTSPPVSVSNTLVDVSVSPCASLSPHTTASGRHIDLEEQWFRRMAALMADAVAFDSSSHTAPHSVDADDEDTDTTPADAVASVYLLFGRLLADIQRAFVITVDECLLLVPPALPTASLCRSLRLSVKLLSCLQLPAVYINGRALRRLGIEMQLRFCLLELQEHVCTYQERRAVVLRRVAATRCSLTLDDTGTASAADISSTCAGTTGSAGQLVDQTCVLLFGALCRLHFQLLLLLDSWLKSLDVIASATAAAAVAGSSAGNSHASSSIISLSAEVEHLRGELARCVDSVAGYQDGAGAHEEQDVETAGCRDEAETWLARLLAEGRCAEALFLFRRQRHLFSPDQLLAYDGDDADSMLAVYCWLRSGADCLPLVAVCGRSAVTSTCDTLQSVNASLLVELRQVERCGRGVDSSQNVIISSSSSANRHGRRRRRRQLDLVQSESADC